METVAPHPHAFDEADWPFAEPVNALSVSTVRVFREGYPVLRVSHDEDGDWQVLCDTTINLEHCVVVCLGCCYQRDSTLGEIADLPLGWTAWREFVGGPWSREPKSEDDDA
ncbi:MAG: hypothetical protein M3Q42_00120 [Pseudomonadota bacterium]|nr:hypothetical protein [Pseudomonadota bacterium]